MKKIYDRRVLLKVDGWKEFDDTSMFRHLKQLKLRFIIKCLG